MLNALYPRTFSIFEIKETSESSASCPWYVTRLLMLMQTHVNTFLI